MGTTNSTINKEHHANIGYCLLLYKTVKVEGNTIINGNIMQKKSKYVPFTQNILEYRIQLIAGSQATLLVIAQFVLYLSI